MAEQLRIKRITTKYVQNHHQIDNRTTLPTCLYCAVTHLTLTTGVAALHIPSWRVRVREEHRKALKAMWPVHAGRVIYRYQNNLFGIINHQQHIWSSFSEVYVADLNIVALHLPPSEAATTVLCQKSKQSCYIGRYYMWCISELSRQSIFMQLPIKIRKPMKCG